MPAAEPRPTTEPVAADVCEHFSLTPPARQLLKPALPASTFLALLVRNSFYADGVRFLAHFLPPRLAVWWGCLCVRHAGGDPLPSAQEEALRAAVRWVLDPSEEHRRAAEEPGRAATIQSPAGCLAHGVFWSGGSVAAPDFPPVPPKPFMTARVVAGAVLLAAVQANDGQVLRRLLAVGVCVASGCFAFGSTRERPHGPV